MSMSFTALHDAMAETLKRKIPRIRHVSALEEIPTDATDLPAVYISLDEMTPGKKRSGGRISVTCTFTATCLLSTQLPRASLEVRNMAFRVLSIIDGNRWGMEEQADRPQRLTALPGSFESGGHGLECWIVEWDQVLHMGEEWMTAERDGVDWLSPDPVPDGVWLNSCHDHPHRLEDFKREHD
ncbi:MAG: hypothetical protein ACRC8D_06005 [Aeromonas sp.]